eukprot:jgi/Psemu1/60292/gm1.60292_g
MTADRAYKKEMTAAKKQSREQLKNWIPLVKTGTASVINIIGDYQFFKEVHEDTHPEIVETYQPIVFFFFVLACIMGMLTLISLLIKGFFPKHKLKAGGANQEGKRDTVYWNIAKRLDSILALETIFEDIPQFTLSALVTYSKGEMTDAALINIVTSAYNFIFNVLDMLHPSDDDDDDDDDDSSKDGSESSATEISKTIP